MAIKVTTRINKGSALTYLEVDTNFDNLAVSATDAAEGNIRLSTQSEANLLTDATTAISPGTLSDAIDSHIDDRSLSSFTLFSGNEVLGDDMLSWVGAGLVTVAATKANTGFVSISIPADSIVIGEVWNFGLSDHSFLGIKFTSNTHFEIQSGVIGFAISKITGLRLS